MLAPAATMLNLTSHPLAIPHAIRPLRLVITMIVMIEDHHQLATDMLLIRRRLSGPARLLVPRRGHGKSTTGHRLVIIHLHQPSTAADRLLRRLLGTLITLAAPASKHPVTADGLRVLHRVLDLVLAMTLTLLALVRRRTTVVLAAMRATATLDQHHLGAALALETIPLLAHGMPTSGTDGLDRHALAFTSRVLYWVASPRRGLLAPPQYLTLMISCLGLIFLLAVPTTRFLLILRVPCSCILRSVSLCSVSRRSKSYSFVQNSAGSHRQLVVHENSLENGKIKQCPLPWHINALSLHSRLQGL